MPPCLRTGKLDLGSVSTGYSDKPVAMAIKIKHAGFNLTGPKFLMHGSLLSPSTSNDRRFRAGSKKASPEVKKGYYEQTKNFD